MHKEHSVKERQKGYATNIRQVSEAESVFVSLKPQVKLMLASIPKLRLSCMKEGIKVKHKVFLVVHSHYVICQVTLIWKKTGFLYKAFCAPVLM